MYVCIYICVCVRVCVYLFPHRTRTCTHTSRFSSMMIGKWMVVPKILNFPCYHHLNYLKLCRCPVSGGAGFQVFCWRLLAGPDPGSPWPRPTAVARVVLRAAAPCLADGDASLGWRWWDHPRTPVTSLRGPKSSPRKELPGSSPKFSDASYFQYASKMQLGILFMSTSTFVFRDLHGSDPTWGWDNSPDPMVVDQFMPINVAESCANDLEHSEMKTMCSTRTFPGQCISPSSNSVVFQVQEHSGN